MKFTLALGCIAKFDHLRQDYETQKHVDLNQEPSRIGLPTFFGGTDVVSRNKQVTFLEKIKTVLKIHFSNEENIKTDLERQVYIIATRFMVAACMYVNSKIGSSKRNSVLYRLIEDNFGITSENYLDDEDKELFYSTAKQLINTPKAFEHANATLKKEKIKPFSKEEWRNFSKFLDEQCDKKETKDKYTNFPIISLTQPLFGAAFSYVGATVGVVLAEGMSNSTSAISPRVQLTALVGSTLLILSPSGTTGVALFAPVIATRLLTSFCTISIAHIMSTVGGLLGKGVGIGVGLPFDIAYNLLSSICSIVKSYYSKESHLPVISGIRLADGATIIAGVPVQLMSDSELTEGYTKKILEISENGEIHIEGEKLHNNNTPTQLPHDVIEELKKQFATCTKDQEFSWVNQETLEQTKNEENSDTRKHPQIETMKI
ncbi:MAG: hypothetical protein HYX60_07420 [Legionella longbeachae]|nr:hypothetical protein [Legionella longbeachae]